VNGAQTFVEMVTHTVGPAFDAPQVVVGSNFNGTLHLSPKGVVSLSVAVPR